MHVLSYCILGVKSDKFSHNTTYSSWICKINVFSCLFISYSTMMLYSVIIYNEVHITQPVLPR